MQLFLSQLALLKGGEDDAIHLFLEILTELKKIDSLKFGHFQHKIKLKCVFDFSAIWKVLKRASFKIDESSTLDKVVYKFEKSEGKLKFFNHRGCPFCLASRKCPNNCSKNLNFLKSNSNQCHYCYNRYSNFGVFEFHPGCFSGIGGLKPTDFIPCTIHAIKAITIRMLKPFALCCYNTYFNFKQFEKACNEIFGVDIVKAEYDFFFHFYFLFFY